MKFLVLVMACFAFADGSAQSDSIRRFIREYPESRDMVIWKGRQLMMEKLRDNNRVAVADLMDYLLREMQNDSFRAFHPKEQWMLDHWLGRFVHVLDAVRYYDADQAFLRNAQEPGGPELLQKLKDKLYVHKQEIMAAIDRSAHTENEKEFLRLHFLFAIMDNRKEDITQDSLNARVGRLNMIQRDQALRSFANTYMRLEETEPLVFISYEFSCGMGLFTEDLHQKFRNFVPFGIALEFSYQKFLLDARGSLGFSESREHIFFSSGTWLKNTQATLLLLEIAPGYIVYEDKNFRAAPFLGIGTSALSPERDSLLYPEHQYIGLDFTTTFAAGMKIQYRIPDRTRSNLPQQRRRVVSLRYALYSPHYDRKYKGFAGQMHQLTLGYGGTD